MKNKKTSKSMSKGISKRMSMGKKLAIAGGAVAAGMSAYAFLGPKGKQNQKKLKEWAMKMEKMAEKKAMPKIKKMEKIAAKAAKSATKDAVSKIRKIVNS